MALYQQLSSQQIISLLQEECILKDADQVDAVYIPPTLDSDTDEEDLFDDALWGYADTMTPDIPRTYELHTNLPIKATDNSKKELVDLTTKKKPKITEPASYALPPVWQRQHPIYTRFPIDVEPAMAQTIEMRVCEKTPAEIFALYFSDEVFKQILEFTLKYARDQKRSDFTVTLEELKRFVGILLLTGYRRLPKLNLYWSKDEDKTVSIVRNSMSRNKFYSIKKNIHLCDNAFLDTNDKFAKLRPIFDIINQNNLQFGIFAHNLCVGAQMVPYFGRHSNKICFKGKPVRFGFKLWCLCSSNGYMYQFIPYRGQNSNVTRKDLYMGENAVLDLLTFIEVPGNHRIFFDSFFSSYKLFCILKERGYFATGMIREERMNNNILLDKKSIEKEERGLFDYCFNSEHEILLVRWNDKTVCDIATNNSRIKPMDTVERYDRQVKRTVKVQRPQVMADYNMHIGGVERHDSDITQFRIRTASKKWWWPLFIHLIDSAMVNAWHIYNIGSFQFMSLLEFKSKVALSLMRSGAEHLIDDSEFLSRPNASLGRPSKNALPPEFRFDNIGHVIKEDENKRRRRCRQCKSSTIYMCRKCKVYLHPHCFEKFHTK